MTENQKDFAVGGISQLTSADILKQIESKELTPVKKLSQSIFNCTVLDRLDTITALLERLVEQKENTCKFF